MSAIIIDGKTIAADLRAAVKAETERLRAAHGIGAARRLHAGRSAGAGGMSVIPGLAERREPEAIVTIVLAMDSG